MGSSNRRALACILFLLATASFTHAQKDQTASISGKVTLKNKGLGGIVVVATDPDYSGGWQRARNRGTTDDEGNYRINNVAAGNYQVYPVSLELVAENGQSNQRLSVAAGETIRDVNFAMVHGGVITGRITDADGQPLVEETVSVTAVEPDVDYLRPNFNGVQTDDRGVYRAFGLRRGKYKVSVGESGAILPGYTRPVFKQTFYPSVTDPEKATILEVTESSEIKDINIVTSAPGPIFKITGRIIDGETGKPLPNVMLGVHQIEGNSSAGSSGGIRSNGDGEFKVENAAPGKYMLIAMAMGGDWRADPLSVDVVDKDLTGVEIKTKRAASLAGVVVLESSDDKVVAKFKDLFIFASNTTSSGQYDMATYPVQISPDGSFKIVGLAAGNIRIHVRERTLFQFNPLEIISVEQNGVPQPGGIELKDGEQLGGLRIVAKHLKLTGAIRGQIKFENGELPPGNRIVIAVNRVDESSSKSQSEEFSSPPEVDSRGRFLIERLAAGTYELRVIVIPPGGYVADEGTTQQVTVNENAVSEVTVIVKLKP
jgi:protocatechuate 3,4-dioxygenase beta subunit